MITSKMLRSGSKGLQGTIENATHHAPECLPLIDNLVIFIKDQGLRHDFTWSEAHNVHVITNWNGDSIYFRPYKSKAGWGIEVGAKVSRSVEMRLMTIRTKEPITRFKSFFKAFVKFRYKNRYESKSCSPFAKN